MPQQTKAGKQKRQPAAGKLIPFLSYSKRNREQVLAFVERLKLESWIDPWFDEEDILPGQVWEDTVIDGVRNSHAVLIFLSTNAMISEGFFHKEIRLALDTAAEKPEGTIFIIPIRLDQCDVPEMLKKYQYIDYFGDDGHMTRLFASLIAALKVRAQTLGIKM